VPNARRPDKPAHARAVDVVTRALTQTNAYMPLRHDSDAPSATRSRRRAAI
jgi:hypothetical protein